MTYEPPAELLEILADPESKGPIRLATDDELGRIRQALDSGKGGRKDGKDSSGQFEAAFLAQDGAVAYVVEDGIPVFLIDQRLEFTPPIELDKEL